jgi:hypothetical protein
MLVISAILCIFLKIELTNYVIEGRSIEKDQYTSVVDIKMLAAAEQINEVLETEIEE